MHGPLSWITKREQDPKDGSWVTNRSSATMSSPHLVVMVPLPWVDCKLTFRILGDKQSFKAAPAICAHGRYIRRRQNIDRGEDWFISATHSTVHNGCSAPLGTSRKACVPSKRKVFQSTSHNVKMSASTESGASTTFPARPPPLNHPNRLCRFSETPSVAGT